MTTVPVHYVNIVDLARSCDVHPKSLVSDETTVDASDYDSIKDGDAVFVTSSALDDWNAKVLPRLVRDRIRIVLVTGNSLCLAPKSDIAMTEPMSSGVVMHWFAQYPASDCPRRGLTPIPVGVDFHTLESRPEWGEPVTPRQKQDAKLRLLSDVGKESWESRAPDMLIEESFLSGLPSTKAGVEEIRKSAIPHCIVPFQRRDDYWAEVSRHRFVFCPPGFGYDCHRTWEVLALGSVPILIRSEVSDLFQDLPVIVVDSIGDLSAVALAEFKYPDSWPVEKLSARYWLDKVREKQLALFKAPAPAFRRLHVCGCARNVAWNADCIAKLFRWVLEASPLPVVFSISESDSSDDTVEVLKRLQATFENCWYISHGALSNRLKHRTERIAFNRNACLDRVLPSDVVLTVDLDLPFDPTCDLRALIKRMEDDSTIGGITGVTPKQYYDSWAARYFQLPNDYYILMSNFGGSTELFTRRLGGSYQRTLMAPGTKFVRSAFNGVGLYRGSDLCKTFYFGKQWVSPPMKKENIHFKEKRISKDLPIYECCEHVFMNRMLRHQGKTVLVDPTLVVSFEWLCK
jgi:hypothetical protein